MAAVKRKNRLPLLGVLCLALVIIALAALFIWLNQRNNDEEERKEEVGKGSQKGEGRRGEEGGEGGRGGGMEETEGMRTKEGGREGTRMNETAEDEKKEEEETGKEDEKKEAEEKGRKDEEAEAEGTTVTVGPPEEEVQQPEGMEKLGIGGGHAPDCPIGEWTRKGGAETDCDAEEATIPAPESPSGDHPEQALRPADWLRPLDYSLNLSVPSSDSSSPSTASALSIRLSILAELNREANVIPLHCGHQIGIDAGDGGERAEQLVRVFSCSSGLPLCVRSLARLPNLGLLLIHLATPLPSGSLIRIQFPRLRLPLAPPNPALLVQIPSPWERDRAWMIASQFPSAGGIRTVLPSVDEPDARAVFRLCLSHSRHTTARANTPLAFVRDSVPSSSSSLFTSCFRDTPPLPPSQFAFALFRNLQPVPSVPSPSSDSSPAIELFIGAHLNPADYEWAIEKSRKTMERMRKMARSEYPTDKLTLVSSPLPTGHDAVGGLGLAHIRDSWMEYPKFVHTHELLVGHLVRQWTAPVLNVCDRCFQRGLGLFLEWTIGAELSTDPGAEFGRRFGESRKKLMQQEGVGGGGGEEGCPDRVAAILHMLESTFGKGNTSKWLEGMFRKYGWQARCTGMGELSKLYRDNTGSPEAQRVFDSFLMPSPSASAIPLVHIQVFPNQSLVRLSQSSPHTAPPRSVPVELIDDTLKRTRLLLNSTLIEVPLVLSSFALALPSTFARFVYNVENYAELAKCSGERGGGGCAEGTRNAVQSAWEDLCWALFSDQLDPAAPSGDASSLGVPSGVPRRWLSLFRSLSARGAVRGDCACCMMPKAEALRGHCRWTWADRCERIELLRGEV